MGNEPWPASEPVGFAWWVNRDGKGPYHGRDYPNGCMRWFYIKHWPRCQNEIGFRMTKAFREWRERQATGED